MDDRVFRSKRSRALPILAAIGTWLASFDSALDCLEEPSAWNANALWLGLACALFATWVGWGRCRPILSLRGDSLQIGSLASLPGRVVDLSDIAAVEDETGFVGRFWDVLRVRLRSGASFRLYLSDLHDEERPLVRALLEEAVARRRAGPGA